MKKSMQTIIVVFFSMLSTLAFADYNPEVGLYTKEEYAPLPVNRLPEILERFNQETPEKNIIFYIHGRGRHTEEEWQGLSRFEKNYDARVVMFHWPSWTSLLVRPVDKAKASADELAQAFNEIKQYKDENLDMFTHKKISLLIHSMGHIVLREFVEKHYAHDLNDNDGKPLFDNFVSTGADIGMTDHKGWFSSIDFVHKKYVTMNNRDLMLLLSYLLDIKSKTPFFYKLGLGVGRMPFKKNRIEKMLDSSTTYIDLSRSLKTDHRYFESEKPLMLKIFKPLVNGESFVPEMLQTKVKQEQSIYYVMD